VSKNHLGDEVRYSRWGISDDYQMLIELVQKATKEVEKGTPPNSNSISADAGVDGLQKRIELTLDTVTFAH
jgi:hypothetical protein